MTFKEAVVTVYKKKYFDFHSRASRSEYWYGVLAGAIFPFVLLILMGIALALTGPNAVVFGLFGLLFVVYLLGVIIPGIALSVRRFHDLNKTGWFVLLFWVLGAIPYVGFISGIVNLIFFCKKGTEGANKYGEDPLA